MNKKIKQLSGANMDIDLASAQSDIHWKQSSCPWNQAENTSEHKCAVKNISLCDYFCGIQYLDSVLCSYPYEASEIFKEEEPDGDGKDHV
jgi:hypothetical protein